MKEQIKEILKKFAGDNIAISEKDFDELSVEISEELSLAPSVTDEYEYKKGEIEKADKILMKWLKGNKGRNKTERMAIISAMLEYRHHPPQTEEAVIDPNYWSKCPCCKQALNNKNKK